MKQIDDIYDAYLNATIGPCQNLRRFASHQDILNKRGYQLNLFTRDFLFNEKEDATPVDFSKGLYFRSYLKKIIKKSALASVLFQIRKKKEAEMLVKAYLKLNRHPDIIVFRSLYEAHYYINNRKGKEAKVLLFHEDDGIRLKMFLQSYPKLTKSFWEKMIRRWSEDLDRQVDRNVFIAYTSLKKFAEENPDIPQSKLVAFHNGIDNLPCIRKERVSDYKYNLCVSGTICARKGQYIIINALEKSSKEVRNKIHVTMIGSGDDMEILKSKVKNLGFGKNVSFLGNISNSKVHDILCGCDIYILMSNSEGLPISIIEGLRAGLGVISTPVAGIPEMVDETNGVLINPDSEELAEVFAHIDDFDWDTFGKNSRKKFEEEFDFRQMLSSYCDMMDRLYD